MSDPSLDQDQLELLRINCELSVVEQKLAQIDEVQYAVRLGFKAGILLGLLLMIIWNLVKAAVYA